MATTGVTDIQIVNMALRLLGEDPITALTDTTRRAQTVNLHWLTTQDALMDEHPWRFLRTRVTLYAYTTPAADLTLGSAQAGQTGVAVTASAAVFAATDIGKQIRGTVSGRATITAFGTTSSVIVTIVDSFSSTSVTADSWRLFNAAPAWGYANTIERPSDCLRIWSISECSEHRGYQVESDVIVTDAEALNVLYQRLERDTTKYPPTYVQALVAKLAQIIAETITGQKEKAQLMEQLYEIRLRLAKAKDSQEGTPRQIQKPELIRVRFGG